MTTETTEEPTFNPMYAGYSYISEAGIVTLTRHGQRLNTLDARNSEDFLECLSVWVDAEFPCGIYQSAEDVISARIGMDWARS